MNRRAVSRRAPSAGAGTGATAPTAGGRRRAAVRALLGGMLIVLAGCGRSAGQGAPAPSTTPGPAPAADPTPIVVSLAPPPPTATPVANADRIAFASTRGAQPDRTSIYTMNADGSGLQRLTDGAATDTEPAWAPDRSRIAFVSDREGSRQIYVMQADGTGARRVSSDRVGAASPTWAPDGAQLAYTSGAGEQTRIAIIDLDARATTVLDLALPGARQPAWSPDGDALAVVAPDATADGTLDVFLVDLADASAMAARVTNLTNHPGNDELPAWSPDSRRIAFQSDRGGSADVYVMLTSGAAQTPLVEGPDYDGQPSWSSDGRRLVLISRRGGSAAVHVADDSGRDLVPVTRHAAEDAFPRWQPPPPAPFVDQIAYGSSVGGASSLVTTGVKGGPGHSLTRGASGDGRMPAWSPDGARIAFVSNRDGDDDIWLISADGAGEAANVSRGPSRDLRPAWSPDGRQIAFESNRSGRWGIWVMGADGASPRELAAGTGDSGNPTWSPDGTRIAFASNRGGTFDLWVVGAAGRAEPAALTSTPDADELNPAWSPRGDQIAYRASRGANRQLFILDVAGRTSTPLPATEADDDHPAWSPDGTRLAFVSNRLPDTDGDRSPLPSQPFGLYLFSLESWTTTPVVTGRADVRYPTWKPRPRR